MFTPIKCDSMNDIHLNIINTEGSSQNIGSVLSGITTICNQPNSITQGTDFKINSNDDANFQVSNNRICEKLDSFFEMNEKTIQGSTSGGLKNDIQEIRSDVEIRQIRQILDGDKTTGMASGLRECFVKPYDHHKDFIAIGTRYSFKKGERDNQKDSIQDVIFACGGEITGKRFTGLSGFNTKSVNCDNLIFIISVSFLISLPEINKTVLDNTFSILSKHHNESPDNKKFIFGHLAIKLRNYLAQTLPSDNGVEENDFLNLSNTWPELFLTGDNVVKLLGKP